MSSMRVPFNGSFFSLGGGLRKGVSVYLIATGLRMNDDMMYVCMYVLYCAVSHGMAWHGMYGMYGFTHLPKSTYLGMYAGTCLCMYVLTYG